MRNEKIARELLRLAKKFTAKTPDVRQIDAQLNIIENAAKKIGRIIGTPKTVPEMSVKSAIRQMETLYLVRRHLPKFEEARRNLEEMQG